MQRVEACCDRYPTIDKPKKNLYAVKSILLHLTQSKLESYNLGPILSSITLLSKTQKGKAKDIYSIKHLRVYVKKKNCIEIHPAKAHVQYIHSVQIRQKINVTRLFSLLFKCFYLKQKILHMATR